MDFRPFFNTMAWCAQGRHELKQIAAWIRASQFPLETLRDHLAYALAVATREGISDRNDLDTQTEAFVRDQHEAARQYARLLIELYPIGDDKDHTRLRPRGAACCVGHLTHAAPRAVA